MLWNYLGKIPPVFSLVPFLAGLTLYAACEQGGSTGQRRQRSEVSTSTSGKEKSSAGNGLGKSGESGSGATGGTGSSSGTQPTLSNDKSKESAPKTQGGYISRTLTYGADQGGDLKGYYLAPDGLTTMGPGVILIHGITGLTGNFKKNMETFASQGYRVFAPDLFSGTVPETKEQGEELMSGLNARGRQSVIGMISAAGQYLFDTIKVSSVGIVGWDVGGYWSIATFLTFKKQFSAVVNFYGSPFELSKQPSEISAPMLHVFVQEDQNIDITEVIGLEKDLKSSSQYPVTFHKFQGVDSDFLDSVPDGQVDRDNVGLAYQFTLDFLAKHLKGEGAAPEKEQSATGEL